MNVLIEPSLIRTLFYFLQFLVLDEADRLLEKGHFTALTSLLAHIRSPVDSEGKDTADEGTPAHLVLPSTQNKRQTMLFSATLGLDTPQSSRDAVKSLLAAEVQVYEEQAKETNAAVRQAGEGSSVPNKISKKALQRAKQRAEKMTPMETLMSRVGITGKPLIVSTKKEEVDGIEDEQLSDLKSASSSIISSEISKSTVALPASLRLCKISVSSTEKDESIYYFLSQCPGRTLIFVNAISTLKLLSALLSNLRLPVQTLHAGMPQRQRLAHLDDFREGKVRILIATDVAARGLDIPSIEYVVNYSMPASIETFVHRCGRTARASKSGLAVVILSPKDVQVFTKTMSILNLSDSIPEFPVDKSYSRSLIQRLSLARKITSLELAIEKQTSVNRWLTNTATATDIDVEINDEKWATGKQRQLEKGERLSSLIIDGDDIQNDPRKGLTKKQTREIKYLRQELGRLLEESLTPKGVSKKFVAVDPKLEIDSTKHFRAIYSSIKVEHMDGNRPKVSASGALVASKVLR
jgi:superfamily II DNA/RNA helicase